MNKNFFEILFEELPEMIVSNFKDVKILALSSIVPILIEMFSEYVFSDWQIVGYLVTLVFFDTATKLSSLKKSKQAFSIKKLGQSLFNKIIKYSALLAISHVLENVKGANGELIDILTGWAATSIYVLLIVIEVESIFVNIGFAVGGKFKAILDTVKQFGNFNIREADGGEDRPEEPRP